MKVFGVDVGVALKRPPKTDEYRRVVVAAGDETEASLLATQIAQADDRVVMATESVVTDWPDECSTCGRTPERPCAQCLGLDPYVEEADANPERRDNGCMVYRTAGPDRVGDAA